MLRFFDFLVRHFLMLLLLLIVAGAAYWAYFNPYSLGDSGTYLFLIGAQLLLWAVFHYRRVFFLVVMISFLLAGTNVPFRGIWGAARWPVLLCAGIVGLVLWLKEEKHHFGAIHLLALFCVVAALTSAVVSAFPRTALLKSMSLLLLFAYTTSGARISILNREWQYPRTLVTVCEVAAYLIGISHFGAHFPIFGNPNSLGAVLGVVVVPLLAWGLMIADSTMLRRRRAFALAISASLLVVSHSRSGLLAGIIASAFLLLSLKRYRFFLRCATAGVAVVAVVGIWSPDLIWRSADTVQSDLIYKGHRNSGLLASRRQPWDATLATIQSHPFLGGGFGTTETGAEDERGASTFSTTAGTSREHGNSYLALLEWVGLVGIVPFLLLLGCVLLEVRAVSRYMRHTLDGSHPAIPLAMVCLAGLVGTLFEDWLFAVGYYLTVFVWSTVFCLADTTRRTIRVPTAA